MPQKPNPPMSTVEQLRALAGAHGAVRPLGLVQWHLRKGRVIAKRLMAAQRRNLMKNQLLNSICGIPPPTRVAPCNP